MKRIYKYHEECYADIFCLHKSSSRNDVPYNNGYDEYFYANDRRIYVFQDYEYKRKKNAMNFLWLLETNI